MVPVSDQQVQILKKLEEDYPMVRQKIFRKNTKTLFNIYKKQHSEYYNH